MERIQVKYHKVEKSKMYDGNVHVCNILQLTKFRNLNLYIATYIDETYNNTNAFMVFQKIENYKGQGPRIFSVPFYDYSELPRVFKECIDDKGKIDPSEFFANQKCVGKVGIYGSFSDRVRKAYDAIDLENHPISKEHYDNYLSLIGTAVESASYVRNNVPDKFIPYPEEAFSFFNPDKNENESNNKDDDYFYINGYKAKKDENALFGLNTSYWWSENSPLNNNNNTPPAGPRLGGPRPGGPRHH